MKKKILTLTSLLCIVLVLQFSGISQPLQNRQPRLVPNDTPTDGNSQSPSVKRRILISIAKAVMDALCKETGDCPSTSETPTGTGEPTGREQLRSDATGSDLAGNSTSAIAGRDFSFATPDGWQRHEGQSSVTVAPPSGYVDGNLTNGVILGLFPLTNVSFEKSTEAYVKQLISGNKYLKRVGPPESNNIQGVPCITNRFEGVSPRTRELERVVVYTFRRNALNLFYVDTVNSGPNANGYEIENGRITQSINFRQ